MFSTAARRRHSFSFIPFSSHVISKGNSKMARKSHPQCKQRTAHSSERALRCERLETRCLLAVVTVDLADDVIDFNDGKTSLREAIFATNTVPGADEIRFDF